MQFSRPITSQLSLNAELPIYPTFRPLHVSQSALLRLQIPMLPLPLGMAVTIFNSPLLSGQILLSLAWDAVGRLLRLALRHLLPVLLLGFLLSTLLLCAGPHQPFVAWAGAVVLWAVWWIGLGVASSIGLGTGLHTFVLYLGPHIAKVTLVAYECNSVPTMLPSRWAYQTFADCPDSPPLSPLSLWTVLAAVQPEAVLWGLGTALGELPPYFISRAARAAGKADEWDLEETAGKISSFKLAFARAIKKYAFLTVLLCASIPNPLFDLAGLLCGHFGVSFWVFFGATLLGKAIFKVHFQVIFTILLFSEQQLDSFLSLIATHLPSFSTFITSFLESQRKSLHSPQFQQNRPLLMRLWELVILGMVAFFVVTLLNSLVQGQIVLNRQEKEGNKSQLPPVKFDIALERHKLS